MKRTLALVAVLSLLLPAVGRAELPWLHVQGTDIVDAQGRKTQLRAINLGGWLVEEMWMLPFVTNPPAGTDLKRIRDHVTLWSTVEKRLGADATQRVRMAYRNAWLNESDFDRLKAAGFNCVRLPFLASLIDEPNGWSWLDNAVDWAGKRGIYVILDMHGAPGGQSGEHHTGEEGRDELFRNPEMVKRTCDLWTRIARRYKDRPGVAGYDLLNEPMGAPNTTTLYIVQDRIYQAVRQVDPQHIVIIEDGYKGLDNTPRLPVVGWTNIVLSAHSYKFDAKSAQDHIDYLKWFTDACAKSVAKYPAPLFIGEFCLEPYGTGDTAAAYVKAFMDRGWSWAWWTYKIAMPGGNGSMWGLYRSTKPTRALDPFQDSEADLIAKCAQYRTESMDLREDIAKAFRDAAVGSRQSAVVD